MSGMAGKWRKLSGEDHWNGMLKPLDKDLRQYLIHYGDLVQSSYDSFITQGGSRFAGGNRFSMNKLMSGAGLVGQNPMMQYQVTKYLYAMSSTKVPGSFMMSPSAENPWSNHSNWMGFVAVANDKGKKALGRRDIVVVWRGSITGGEWADDMEAQLVPATVLKSPHSPKVQEGFYSVYTSKDPSTRYNKQSAREQALGEVRRLVEQYKNDQLSVTVCGHSLGAAIAILCAADIAANGLAGPKLDWFKKSGIVTAFAYASPRVGDQGFKKTVDQMGVATNSELAGLLRAGGGHGGKGALRILRITNRPDQVTKVPMQTTGYVHVGQEFVIDSTQSPYLASGTSGVPHDMEVYLHCIAGAQSSLKLEETEEEKSAAPVFKLIIDRDLALVNKHLDGLKEENFVEPNWWVEMNKGMRQQPNGDYLLQSGDWILQPEESYDEELEQTLDDPI